MASVIPHGNTWRIGFTGLDRKRRTIYAGAISERNAHELRRLVERILEAASLGKASMRKPRRASRHCPTRPTTNGRCGAGERATEADSRDGHGASPAVR